MLIIMIETRLGSEDGRRVCLFKKGETYDIADNLAESLIASGYATPANNNADAKTKRNRKTKRRRKRHGKLLQS